MNTNTNELDVTDVSVRWLQARDAFHEGGEKFLQTFCDLDELLLAVFAGDWQPSNPKDLATAYGAFRDRLVEQHEARKRAPVVFVPVNLNDLILC